MIFAPFGCTTLLFCLLLAATAWSDAPCRTGWRYIKLSVLAVATVSIAPLVTLALYGYVFMIHGSSNVAQLAGDEGFAAWRLWSHAWIPLFYGNLIGAVASLCLLGMPPYSYMPLVLSKTMLLMACVMSWLLVCAAFPDA